MWQIVISCSQLRSSINGGTQSCNFLPATSSIRLQQGQLVGRLTLATLPAEVRHSGIVSNETPLILILILAPLCDPSLLTLFIPPLRRSSSIGYISVILIDSSSTLSDSIHQLSLNLVESIQYPVCDVELVRAIERIAGNDRKLDLEELPKRLFKGLTKSVAVRPEFDDSVDLPHLFSHFLYLAPKSLRWNRSTGPKSPSFQ